MLINEITKDVNILNDYLGTIHSLEIQADLSCEIDKSVDNFFQNITADPKKWLQLHAFGLSLINNDSVFQLEVLKFLFEVSKYDWKQISNDSVKPNSGTNNNSNDT